MVVGLDSDEIDEVCNNPDSFLFRTDGFWGCATMNDTVINITVNNITNIYTNFSVYSDYWDGKGYSHHHK